ncbi:FliA/WhiG family RNA polymerase sigma factor [Dermatophilaceae bacterium Soc4.6]
MPPTTTSPTAPASPDDLVTSHMPLVGHIVRETMGRVPAHVSRDDLTSAGMLALVLAARAFDPTRGVPFAGYAATRVRGAILDELRRVDWASRSVRRRARDLDETRNRLAAILGRIPTTAEVASALSVPIEDISRNEGDIARASVLSLEGTENSDGPVLASTSATPDQVVEHLELLTYLMEAVTELPERLRVVVTEYFLAERPMAEIAADLGVSESRISQIRAEALVLLRTALQRELDPELAEQPDANPGCASRRRESYYASVAARHSLGLRQQRPVELDETA